ncbi:MAG: prenyltransferase/squalene oxidase repeat-containing protein [Candidatus Bathyarchaeia archaeon]
MQGDRRLSRLVRGLSLEFSWVKHVVRYVLDRRNMDGGYAFCQGLESNVQDTYYGLAILDILGASPPGVEETVEWLRGFKEYDLYSHYYVAKALRICGEEPDIEGLRGFISSLPVVQGDFDAEDIYIEAASELLPVYMMVELAVYAGVEVDPEKLIDRLLGFKNMDGGFGAGGYSNLNATYHAVASLRRLGFPAGSLRETLGFVRACERPSGGYTATPRSYGVYMEHVYYGVSILEFMGEDPGFPEETAEFIYSCQNSNGGFARSNLGISTFEDTFYAVSTLEKMGRL